MVGIARNRTPGVPSTLGRLPSRLRERAEGAARYARRMGRPSGFEYTVHGDEVEIRHRGVRATVLRGPRARDFLTEVESGDPQLLMARLTGDYRRGNERVARRHPRNQG